MELLKALHVLTRDGGLNLDLRRKLKQVLHLVQLLRPSLDELLAEGDDRNGGDAVIADLGTGKSYLGFLLYDLVVGPAGQCGSLVGVDARRAGRASAGAGAPVRLRAHVVRRGRSRTPRCPTVAPIW